MEEQKEKQEKKSSFAKASEDTVEELQKKLEEAENKSAEYLAGWQRARADFLNYKKEEMERIENFMKYSVEEIVLKLLPILDSFNLAKNQNEKEVEGFLQIKKQLEDFLQSFGVEEVKTIGERFDPNFHEAIDTIEAEEKESGIIVEESQKGYVINGKLIRPAKVKVIK
jgi:molecular chaperone GrpE